MTAAAVARMYAALIGEVDGVWLITPDRLTRVSTVVTADTDRVLGAPIPNGLGYFLGLPEMGPHAGVFGCKGSGGSIAFVDPGHSLAFAFTHNRLTAPPHDSAVQVAARVRQGRSASAP
jgi:CubicO group peptidase (beta-lactamase class C family)